MNFEAHDPLAPGCQVKAGLRACYRSYHAPQPHLAVDNRASAEVFDQDECHQGNSQQRRMVITQKLVIPSEIDGGLI